MAVQNERRFYAQEISEQSVPVPAGFQLDDRNHRGTQPGFQTVYPIAKGFRHLHRSKYGA